MDLSQCEYKDSYKPLENIVKGFEKLKKELDSINIEGKKI